MLKKKLLRELDATGTTLKDTWTKSRGRVEVGEGGGVGWGGVAGCGKKAHNCNNNNKYLKKRKGKKTE